jgi:hypothetical protein
MDRERGHMNGGRGAYEQGGGIWTGNKVFINNVKRRVQSAYGVKINTHVSFIF